MAWPPETALYCSWKEVSVTGEKGRREVHYYLKRRDGSADLAVVGKEKSSRRMSYRYALKNKRSVLYKLKSREDVMDWLNSIVSDALPQQANIPADGSLIPQAARGLNSETLKDMPHQELVHHTKNFLWMGSPWTCRKRRKHYPSFCRNGVRVSVNDFVYILAEQNKRLIAYLEDMYEDSRGSKMVVVRWFHKTDEVGTDLPQNVNDREIFFSLCLQDISVECIDGLATVLSPQHYEKLVKEPARVQSVAFFCQKLYEDDVMKPYDITQLKGYWKQELLRYLNLTISKFGESSQEPGSDPGVGVTGGNCVEIRLRKRHCSSPVEISDVPSANDQKVDCKSSPDYVNLHASATPLAKEEAKPGIPKCIKKGSLVEVLSQDSGIRGCWFRAIIIKKHKDKVKVQYQDIQDAEDESKKLEEWILTSRVAAADHLGLRIPGRKIIRPPPEFSKGNAQWPVDVGTTVDVWWLDGWWEGIVVQKVSEDRFEVYLPGEKKMSVFHRGDIRLSQEWLGDEWVHVKPKSDLVSSVVSSMETKQIEVKLSDNPAQGGVGNGGRSTSSEAGRTSSLPEATTRRATVLQPVPDLLKDVLLSNLKWKASRKRKRSNSCCIHKPGLDDGLTNKSLVLTSRACERPLGSEAFKVDCENCKYIGDALFGSSVVPPLTSLVMSR